MRSRLSTRSGNESGSARPGEWGRPRSPSGTAATGVRVGVRHRDRTIEPEAPPAVGEAEQHGIRGGIRRRWSGMSANRPAPR